MIINYRHVLSDTEREQRRDCKRHDADRQRLLAALLLAAVGVALMAYSLTRDVPATSLVQVLPTVAGMALWLPLLVYITNRAGRL